MYWGHHYWGMHMFWWIFWVAMIVVAFYWLRQAGFGRRGAAGWARHDRARDILRNRYASGELTEEEYRHRLAVLDEHEPAAPSDREAEHQAPTAG